MVASAFSFHGRLGRLAFVIASLRLGIAITVGFIGLVAGLVMTGMDRVGPLGVGLVLLPLVGAALWGSLALHVCRIRDIGWDPTLVILAWIIVNCADKLVLCHLLPKLLIGHRGHETAIGYLGNLGLTLALLFWPSQRESDDDRFLQPGPPRWDARPAASAPLPPGPPRPAHRGAPVFGRR